MDCLTAAFRSFRDLSAPDRVWTDVLTHRLSNSFTDMSASIEKPQSNGAMPFPNQENQPRVPYYHHPPPPPPAAAAAPPLPHPPPPPPPPPPHQQAPAPAPAPPNTGAANRDMNGHLAQVFSNMSLHNNRRPYNHGQYMNMMMPNTTVFGAMPPSSQPIQGPETNPAVPFIPNGIYPPFLGAAPFIPGPIPNFTWPYPGTGELSDPSGMRRTSWPPADENQAPAPAVDQHGQPEYYPPVPPIDRSPLVNYMYNAVPQLQQQCIPFQMMKSPNGYVIQDLDALLKQDPPIPRAVPAMWTNPNELTLAKCLENREGITNVYIRGFPPETTDEMLHAYAARFGKIDRCKAIADLDTGKCKGFGFVQFYSFDSCENCIRGFFHLGYQASFAQKSRNSRLKDLEDKSSTNIYCTNVPIEWTEADLRRHFEPYTVVSEKISRDEKTGVSKEVGFARFETREIAEKVLSEFHNVTGSDGVKLLLRFADTKAQKLLKHQSNERRAYRADEYQYSVAVVNGSTPSPSVGHAPHAGSHISPSSQTSLHSPVPVTGHWTPATSISPTGQGLNKSSNGLHVNHSTWRFRNGAATNNNADSTPTMQPRSGNQQRPSPAVQAQPTENVLTTPVKTVFPIASAGLAKSATSSPRKENVRSGSMSPLARRENGISTPRSTC